MERTEAAMAAEGGEGGEGPIIRNDDNYIVEGAYSEERTGRIDG